MNIIPLTNPVRTIAYFRYRLTQNCRSIFSNQGRQFTFIFCYIVTLIYTHSSPIGKASWEEALTPLPPSPPPRPNPTESLRHC